MQYQIDLSRNADIPRSRKFDRYGQFALEIMKTRYLIQKIIWEKNKLKLIKLQSFVAMIYYEMCHPCKVSEILTQFEQSTTTAGHRPFAFSLS